jgi:hypothetical protein
VVGLFEKPLSYVAPLAQRVDNLGEETINKVVQRYPAVKRPSQLILQDARTAAYRPVQHVSNVYDGAYQRSTGTRVVASGKAAVKTAVVLSVGSTISALRGAIQFSQGLHITETLQNALNVAEHELYEAVADHGTGLNHHHNGTAPEPSEPTQAEMAQYYAAQNQVDTSNQPPASQAEGSNTQPAAK